MKVVDGGYLAWIFGSSKDRTDTWNRSALIEFSARHPAVIIMEGGKLEREKFFPAYKENRKDAIKKKPTRLAQRRLVNKFIVGLERDDRLSKVQVPGLEADDVVAAWGVRHWNETHEPMQVFGIDKDYLQMGSMLDIRKAHNAEVSFPQWVTRQQKKIQPALTEDWHVLMDLVLMGDKVDNVPRLIPFRQLQLVLDIMAAPNPWLAAYEMYGDAFLTNLYMTILPGPWCYDPIPTEDEVFALLIEKGLQAWYQLPVRRDIIRKYEVYYLE